MNKLLRNPTKQVFTLFITNVLTYIELYNFMYSIRCELSNK